MLYLILSITLKTKIIWYISIRLLYPPRYHMIITIIHDTIWYLIYCLIYYVCHFKIHCLGQNHRGRRPFFSVTFLLCITWDKTISTSQYDCLGLNQSMVGSEACGTLITIPLGTANCWRESAEFYIPGNSNSHYDSISHILYIRGCQLYH